MPTACAAIVDVRINPARQHTPADGVDHLGRRRYFQINADGNNLAALAQHISAKLTIGINDGAATYCIAIALSYRTDGPRCENVRIIHRERWRQVLPARGANVPLRWCWMLWMRMP